MIVVLTGGTGGAKLIDGLAAEIDPAELTIICNTGDDCIFHGLHISPDIDTVAYTLAGLIDDAKGWGIKGDTFTTLEQLGRLGADTWFKLGDKDFATHLMRTRLLSESLTLSQVTSHIRRTLGVKAALLPMSDERIETRLKTADKEFSFQEYFVKERWQPEVSKVFYAGVEKSKPAPGVLDAIGSGSGIIIGPSNPVTSIGPILAVPGIRDALKETSATVVGVSPIIGASAITGPAHKLMAAMGMGTSALGVARAYADFLDVFVVANEDKSLRAEIEELNVRAVTADIRMNSPADKKRLAREVLALVKK
ncbi:MAG: 2-phospho-L-lactate transferase [Deltaproteobacteria bacterium]|nr:2-phospho-L-lactate transferase [Deltaproteobacteria bacterium]MBI2181588.1 2-phospho-L-lactate transferase [Deltaproteobacteria bacterium]MBI2228787.1 2-phospho-L-lactate transferase [Deltaproteobacteria bacterium]MBI2365796.1 2-phospho-L-lactate transferase [Deltaproteobacteria bacterium]MBI2532380.1 2-phospho-L-lactate transferase [Deltaproteobacteria bacterium]